MKISLPTLAPWILLTGIFVGIVLTTHPIAAHADGSAQYSHNLPTDAVGQYAYEIGGWSKESDGSACYVFVSKTFTQESFCAAVAHEASSAASKKQMGVEQFDLIDNCGKVTKQNYTYTLPTPLCKRTLSDNPSLTLVSGSETTGALPGGNSGVGALPGGNSGSDATGSSDSKFLVNPLKNITSLPVLLKAIISGLVEIGTVILILAFIWIGFLFIRAQGNPAEIAKARSALMWTIIGGAILLSTEAVSILIQNTVQNL